VAAGTGRNFPFYPGHISELVVTDASKNMTEVARRKTTSDLKYPLHCEVREMNAEKLDFPDRSFDTVVDTFGLCSIEHPETALREMRRVCRGVVLLLEHGRSSHRWVARYQDHRANTHAHRWGCLWNRDIEALIREAGFQIVSHETFQFSTVHRYVLRPTIDQQTQGFSFDCK